jgi:hypothetical protein
MGGVGRSERSGKGRTKLVCFQQRLRAADCIEQVTAAVYSRQTLWQQKHINHHNWRVNDKLWEEVAVSSGSNSNFNVGHPVVHITILL